jgi:hypothetical protein
VKFTHAWQAESTLENSEPCSLQQGKTGRDRGMMVRGMGNALSGLMPVTKISQNGSSCKSLISMIIFVNLHVFWSLIRPTPKK